MMTFTAVPASRRLTSLAGRPVVAGDDMGQFMQACLFAFTDVVPVVRADLDPALNSVGAAASPSANDRYRAGICRERCRKPIHLLDGNDVPRAMLIVNNAVILDQHSAR